MKTKENAEIDWKPKVNTVKGEKMFTDTTLLKQTTPGGINNTQTLWNDWAQKKCNVGKRNQRMTEVSSKTTRMDPESTANAIGVSSKDTWKDSASQREL